MTWNRTLKVFFHLLLNLAPLGEITGSNKWTQIWREAPLFPSLPPCQKTWVALLLLQVRTDGRIAGRIVFLKPDLTNSTPSKKMGIVGICICRKGCYHIRGLGTPETARDHRMKTPCTGSRSSRHTCVACNIQDAAQKAQEASFWSSLSSQIYLFYCFMFLSFFIFPFWIDNANT